MSGTPTGLGGHDPFREPAGWDERTAAQWVTALDQRAAGPHQVALRAALVGAAGVRPGDTVVEVGCGTGPLLAELAAAVGPTGRAIGVEPQPALAAAATARLDALGLANAQVLAGGADDLPVPPGSAAACLAQTVLIHLDAGLLARALAQMCRVVRPGGRVASVDQDGDTWTIDHPDRALTRRIVAFNSDQRYADGWTGRRLPRLFRAAGLAAVTVAVHPQVDTAAGSYLHGMALRLAGAAALAGAITPAERDGWVAALDAQGAFFASINYYLCAGTRPAG